ncbi:MAG TPA: hypothetical protein DCR72_01770 [Pseudomonas sp.]|nr:hypothetical protein [Pseudomonas sp.]
MSSWNDFKKVAQETVGKAPGAGQYVHVHRDSAFELIAEHEALLAERDRMAKALKEIDAADWSSSESATDFAISQTKGLLIGKMKRIARAALQGAQP